MFMPTPNLRPHPLRRIPRKMHHYQVQSPTNTMKRQTITLLTALPLPLLLFLFLFLSIPLFSSHPPDDVPPSRPSPDHYRGILMSCPPGQAHTNKGSWKPSKMTLGVEAVLRQQLRHNTALPLFLAYYTHEQSTILPYCDKLSQTYPINITCFEVPERYPVGLYGYAKIFALLHAPLKQVLWLDCDVFPLRRLDDLFDNRDFQGTGSMFWPDSRDFFDETKVMKLLPKSAKSIFPADAWYVRQGFDSGILLLDTNKCRREIEEMSRIARSPKERRLRSLSMGDKDIFHIVWMLHSKNFTMVPFIGETGSLQASRRSIRILKHSNRLVAKRVHWVMSSQVKYGPDGSAYALHQLHKQQPFSLIASLSQEEPFFPTRVVRSTTHVKPFLNAQADLRLSTPGRGARNAEFVGDVENALIGSAGMPKVVMGSGVIERRGVRLEWTPSWMHAAAAEMGRAWRHGMDADSVAREIFQDHRNVILVKRVRGAYRKSIYKRLWKEPRTFEVRRRNIRRFRKHVDEDRGIRKKIGR